MRPLRETLFLSRKDAEIAKGAQKRYVLESSRKNIIGFILGLVVALRPLRALRETLFLSRKDAEIAKESKEIPNPPKQPRRPKQEVVGQFSN